MKRSQLWILSLGLLLAVPPSQAETLVAAFEPLPPHIEDNGNGLLPSLLTQLDSTSSATFSIELMPYSRAKRELENGRVDLIGFTPYAMETDAFYRFAVEIRWPYAVATDFITLNPALLTDFDQRQIGIPYGNESFAVQMLGVAPEKLYLAELDQLILMLLRGRLDLVWFERSSLHRELAKHPDRPAIHYRQQPAQSIPIAIAVRKDAKGERLKQWLEHEIEQGNVPPLSPDDTALSQSPVEGVVPASKP